MSAAEATSHRPRRAGRDRDDILQVAADVIAQRGIARTRLADVSDAAGVPISTLQYAFGARVDLLLAAFDWAWSDESAALDAIVEEHDRPWDRLLALVRAGIDGFRGGDRRGRLWFESVAFGFDDHEVVPDVLGNYRSWRTLLESAIRAGIASGELSPPLDPADAAIAILALIDGVGLAVALGDDAVGADPMAVVAPTIAALVGMTS